MDRQKHLLNSIKLKRHTILCIWTCTLGSFILHLSSHYVFAASQKPQLINTIEYYKNRVTDFVVVYPEISILGFTFFLVLILLTINWLRKNFHIHKIKMPGLELERDPKESNIPESDPQSTRLNGSSKPEISNMSEPERQLLLQRYLREVWDVCFVSRLSTIGITEIDTTDLELSTIYTELDVINKNSAHDCSSHKNEAMIAAGMESEERMPATKAISETQHLVLLGDPGSGKTTLLNYIALCLSGERLGKKVNLSNLGADWKLPSLLPLRIDLLDYAVDGLTNNLDIFQYIQEKLKNTVTSTGQSLINCLPLIREALEQPDGAIILLDAIDEVPNINNLRKSLKMRIEQFMRDFDNCRIIATSRPYAYHDPEVRLSAFEVRTIADLNTDQIQTYVIRFYDHLGNRDHALGISKSKLFATQLIKDINNDDRLTQLASRPLLLTLMASLHRRREGGSLPTRRQELYEQSVNLLLDLWQRPKQRFDINGQTIGVEYSIWRELGISFDNLRKAINLIAFEAHAKKEPIWGTNNIRARDLVGIFYVLSDKHKTGFTKDVGEDRVLEYMTDRTGLLIERKRQEIYAFPHRVFQEYLAGCYLADEDFPFKLLDCLNDDFERWREACLLAAYKIREGSNIWTLIAHFCRKDWDNHAKINQIDFLISLIAAEALIEAEKHLDVPVRQHDLIARLQGWMVALLNSDKMPLIYRAAAGRALGNLNDIRSDVATDLPVFVYIPSNNYILGREKEKHSVPLPCYWISRYPITNYQYGLFIRDNGYEKDKYWTRTGLKWLREDLQSDLSDIGDKILRERILNMLKDRPFTKRIRPFYFEDNKWNISNHPVVGITWFEAMAYCSWLTEKLNLGEAEFQLWQNDSLKKALFEPEAYEARLPTEAEWEVAATGGDGRQWPWGNTSDIARANTWESRIRRTSAVGLFHEGTSPFMVLDMSGNVWEWCQSLEKNYPDFANDGRENTDGFGWRIVRGASWKNNHIASQCSNRDAVIPDCYTDDLGFRIAITHKSK